MSDQRRYLVTVDAASGRPVKVEEVGEAGDLTPVDLEGFVRSLGAGGASPQPQVVINIYGGAPATAAGTAAAQQPGLPTPLETNICFPPPVAPPSDER